jgi:DNA end-binding protein Ku
MPRAIWSGSVSFGLVNVPVRMYSAIDEQDVRFHLLHEKDDSRIGYEKVCKAEGKPVPDDEIVKAYEIQKGEFVYVTDEDFASAEGEAYKTIDLTDFVPYDEIDPIYFERTYFLGPDSGAEKVYTLLVRAMEDSGLAAIGKYVMRGKQHLGCLRVRDGVLTLEKMYFADEIRPLDEIKPKRAQVGKQELAMAADLIDRFAGAFEPEKYEDTYREALLKVIRAKHKGKDVHAERRPREEETPDLMTALRASLEAAKGRRTAGGRNGASADGALEKLSKAELGKRAKEAGLTGYSKLGKAELVEALRSE